MAVDEPAFLEQLVWGPVQAFCVLEEQDISVGFAGKPQDHWEGVPGTAVCVVADHCEVGIAMGCWRGGLFVCLWVAVVHGEGVIFHSVLIDAWFGPGPLCCVMPGPLSGHCAEQEGYQVRFGLYADDGWAAFDLVFALNGGGLERFVYSYPEC